MRISTTTVIGASLAAIVVGLAAWAALQDQARAQDNPDGAAASRPAQQAALSLPAAQADIYEKLHKRIPVDFREVTLAAALKSLENSLGAAIKLDDAGLQPDHLDRNLSFQIDEPISIQNALQIVLQSGGLYDRKITLQDGGIHIISSEAAERVPVLRTHDLRAASNYSTAMRRRFIDHVRHDIAADSWDKASGGWIVPARSVFAVDVYHLPATHAQIDQLWQSDYLKQDSRHVAVALQELQLWQPGGEKSPEEIQKRASHLQKEYAFLSLDGRLNYEEGGAAAAPPVLAPQVALRLTAREQQAEEARKHAWMQLRTASLEKLHSDEVAKFVARDGFGISRMPQPGPSYLPLPAPPQLALPSAEVEPPAYDLPARVPHSQAEAAAAVVTLPTADRLTRFHAASEGSFLSPERFGYVKDREHVAGFGAHAFMSLPRLEDQKNWYSEPTEQWAIRRLELVSILKHEQPRVYVSDELPNMEKLGEAPTRPLEDFERQGLEKLLAGEDVVTRATTNRIEMLGALRATKQCMQCHDVQRGQVLGAFSYSLVRDPAIIAEKINAH